MNDFNTWYIENKNVLSHLYIELIDISKRNGINIIENKNSYKNFLNMMYNESYKEIIDKDLFPEFFYKKYNSEGYEEYQILNEN